MTEFKVNDFVRQRSADAAGVIQEIRERRGRQTATVLFPNGVRSIPLKELEHVAGQKDRPVDLLRKGHFSGPGSLRQRLAHVRLSGNLGDIFYSMESTDTDFYAHQFKPVVKILDSPTGNLLIADEVGLGKTIEAGLIWTELVARFKYNRLLVVCPKVLCEKWRLELTSKFGINAQICDASSLRELLQSSFHQRSGFVAICGMQGIRPRPKEKRTGRPADLLAEVMEEAQYADKLVDLLVVDEAHHMRNIGTQTKRLGELLCGIAQHTAMLSATPLNLRNSDLHTLLRFLDELTFRDEQALERIIRANRPLIAARDAVLSGKPVEEVLELLDVAAKDPLLKNTRALKKQREELLQLDNEPTVQQRAKYASRLERLNLLSSVVNRTRRRDVEEFRVDRSVKAFRATMTPDEREVYDRITEAVLRYASDNDMPVGFLTVLPQRMLASSLPAAMEHWRRNGLLSGYEDEDGEDDDTWERPLTSLLSSVVQTLPEPAELERQDTKFNQFISLLQEHLEQNPKQKIIVFSTFRSTLNYLRRRLEEKGILATLLHGETKDRVDVISTFARSDDVMVLLASEVGSEGIDLQFARTLINYDLPWNPMRVEQRIGRIDRLGQDAETISVLNLLHRNTVDERIYHRLHERLRLCEAALGGFEEILGQEITTLTGELLSNKLSEEEQERRLAQTEQAIENRRQVEEQLEKEAAALIAHGDYIVHSIRESQTEGNWISDADIVEYLRFALGSIDPANVLTWDKSEGLIRLLLSGGGRHDYEEWCRRKQLDPGPLARSSSDVTFRVGRHAKNKRHTRLGPSHPLIRYLSSELDSAGTLSVNAAAVVLDRSEAETLAPGVYVGAVQAWQIGSGASSVVLGYSLASLEGDETVTPETAERVFLSCLKHGVKWQGAIAEVGTDLLADCLEDVVEPELEERFFEEGEIKKAEVEDRITIQFETLEEHERSQKDRFKDIIIRGGPRLEAANKARLKRFEETVKKRRKQIESQKIEQTSSIDVCSLVLKVSQ